MRAKGIILVSLTASPVPTYGLLRAMLPGAGGVPIDILFLFAFLSGLTVGLLSTDVRNSVAFCLPTLVLALAFSYLLVRTPVDLLISPALGELMGLDGLRRVSLYLVLIFLPVMLATSMFASLLRTR